MATRILVVDNYDSFVFNLVQYLGQLGAECTVVRNDEVSADEASKYGGVLISPGPGEISTPSYLLASSAVTSSLRTTVHSAPSWPRYCTKLKTKES